MNRLENKVCIITGAAGDIGRAAARRFVAEGARVFLVDRDAGGSTPSSRSSARSMRPASLPTWR